MSASLSSRDLFGVAFIETIARAADVSRCGDFRWTLTRTWSSEGGHVCFVGLNPSTADASQDDPTVRRWIHFARAWGYGGFTAVNLYPFRSSCPAECRRWSDYEANGPDWYARDRLQDNAAVVAREAKAARLVVACWGAGAWDDLWVDHLIEEVQSGPAPWPDLHCLAKAKDGSPVHPMARGRHRVPDTAQPQLWRSSNAR